MFDGYKYTRDQVFELLRKIMCARKYFYPLTSNFNCYKGMFDSADLHVAVYSRQGIDFAALCRFGAARC